MSRKRPSPQGIVKAPERPIIRALDPDDPVTQNFSMRTDVGAVQVFWGSTAAVLLAVAFIPTERLAIVGPILGGVFGAAMIGSAWAMRAAISNSKPPVKR